MVPLPTTAAGITKRKGLAVLVGIDARKRVANLSAARQFHMQKPFIALKHDARDREALVLLAFNCVDGLPDGCCPKLGNVRMASNPRAPVFINLFIRCVVIGWRQTPPRA